MCCFGRQHFNTILPNECQEVNDEVSRQSSERNDLVSMVDLEKKSKHKKTKVEAEDDEEEDEVDTGTLNPTPYFSHDYPNYTKVYL